MENKKERYYDKGESYFHNKKFQNAIEEFNKVIEIDDRHFWAYKYKGLSFFFLAENNIDNKTMLNEALHSFNRAIDLESNQLQHKIYNYRGLTNVKLGGNQSAISDFSIAIKIKNDYSEAYLNRAKIYFKIGSKEKGIGDCKSAINLGLLEPTYELLEKYDINN